MKGKKAARLFREKQATIAALAALSALPDSERAGESSVRTPDGNFRFGKVRADGNPRYRNSQNPSEIASSS